MPRSAPNDARSPDDERPRVPTREVWRMVFDAYRASLPLFLVVLLGLILTTWIVTTLLF